jgi:hypothetical protein
LERNVNEMPTFTHALLNDLGDQLVTEMRNNAHVVTGRMKASIYKMQTTDNDIEVGARAPYSLYENQREGTKYGTTHDFATRAFFTVMGRAWNTVVATYDRLFHG